jgi:hypothetical protein
MTSCEKPELGDIYREDDNNESSPLPAFVGIAAVFLLVIAAIFYSTK